MKLEEIGFYTLSEERAKHACAQSRIYRVEILLGSLCNLHCKYCRGVGGPRPEYDQLIAQLTSLTGRYGAPYAVRFSGGEPTLYQYLTSLMNACRVLEVTKRAVSTNGTAPAHIYRYLVQYGMNDVSVSVDACCAAEFGLMAGVKKTDQQARMFNILTDNIRLLADSIYTTAGITVTEDNVGRIANVVEMLHSLKVHDIRLIPAAQFGPKLAQELVLKDEWLDKRPILQYRYERIKNNLPVRGLDESSPSKCPLVLDDMAVMDGRHYPCVIYLREGGKAIGQFGSPNFREARAKWFASHDPRKDPICSKNCLDVCQQYNTQWVSYHGQQSGTDQA